ncbi:MAG: metallophosphoesterase [Clostridia bacterium]|nr:metallophosphoesterase [Clostridia bacterium]
MKKGISVKILSLIMCAALLLSCIPTAFAVQKTFSVATLNDIHYYPESLAGDKRDPFYTYMESRNCVYDDLDAILDAAFASLKYEAENNGVKYVVLAGDLTTNGEYEGHLALSKKLLRFEEESGIKVIVTPGNHDINNSRASSFVNNKKEEARITTPAEFYEFYKDLGFSDAYHTFNDFSAGTAGSLSYSVKTEDGYRLILADGGKFTSDITESGEDEQETAGKFTEALLSWIISEAEDAKKNGETPLLFTHWNMSGMNYFHEFLMQGFVIDDAYKLQEILADSGINYTFSGHQHVSDISITYSDSGNPMYSVITPTLTQFPFAYRVTDFTKNSAGGLDVTFNQRSCDEYSAVRQSVGGGTYNSPYRLTGFSKQHGRQADITEYLFFFIKNFLDGYIEGIKKEGSIVKFIEKEMDIDLAEIINTYLFGGITIDNQSLLTAKNILNFLDDIDRQLMERYVNQKSNTYALIKNTLRKLINTEVSSVPCTKFIDTYHFGSTERGGTLGDAVLSIIAYMYHGNEDISDDAFIQDFIAFTGKTEFIELLISLIKEHIVDGLVFDEILANVDLNIARLFVDESVSVGEYIQMFYTMLLSAIDSGIINATNTDEIITSLTKIFRNFSDVSIKRLIEAVLGTGLINYGSTTDELIDSLLSQFLPESVKEAAVYQANIIIGGMVEDSTKDFGVTYTNNGAIKVIPTKEDMQLPVNVTVNMTEDNSDSFTVNWFTKYSVTATDIEVIKENEAFTGKAKTDNVTAEYETVTYTAPGFDAGSFGILPYTRDIVKHTVTVTGLDADTDYKFRIGDFSRGWTADGSVSTAPDDDSGFTFLHISGSEGYIPSQYKNFADTMTKANELYPDADFFVHSGSLTSKATNDDQWSFAISAAEKQFSNMRASYASGTADNNGEYAVKKYFPVKNAPEQIDDSGTYYSYDYGNCHFAVINTNALTEGGALSKEQTLWLTEDLENADKTWNILVMHESIYGNDTSSVLHSQIVALMNEYHIDLILQGSDNIYVRTDLLSDDAPVLYDTKTVTVDGKDFETYTNANGTVALISGTAGNEFGTEAPSSILFEKTLTPSLPVFSAITIDGGLLTVSSYTVDGDNEALIDSFGIEKSDDAVLLGDCDADNDIDSADARLALRFAVGLDTPDERQILAANADCEDAVTSADARLILRAAVGLEKIYPEYVYM